MLDWVSPDTDHTLDAKVAALRFAEVIDLAYQYFTRKPDTPKW